MRPIAPAMDTHDIPTTDKSPACTRVAKDHQGGKGGQLQPAHTTEITGVACTTPFLCTRVGFTLALGDMCRSNVAFHYHLGPGSKGDADMCGSHKTVAFVRNRLALNFLRIVIDKTPEMYYKRTEKNVPRNPNPRPARSFSVAPSRDTSRYMSLS